MTDGKLYKALIEIGLKDYLKQRGNGKYPFFRHAVSPRFPELMGY